MAPCLYLCHRPTPFFCEVSPTRSPLASRFAAVGFYPPPPVSGYFASFPGGGGYDICIQKQRLTWLSPSPGLLIAHYHIKPLCPKVSLIKGLKNQMTDLPNYNFADGPVKTTLTFTPRSFQNRATVLSPTGMDFLLFQHLRQPYSWPGFESAKP